MGLKKALRKARKITRKGVAWSVNPFINAQVQPTVKQADKAMNPKVSATNTQSTQTSAVSPTDPYADITNPGIHEQVIRDAEKVKGLYNSYIQSGGDPSDPVFANYYNQAKDGRVGDAVAAFEQLANMKIGELNTQK